ncbi:MAG: Zn-dependent hydrolase [Alphaproteobacteria bacterium]|nr:Zn-dependent hydrolase [Alphaproteobacteria bacterium]MBU1514698.1 Zn-dependent hydrolase [Alphaproteobacteria bacterium]MBU2093557.1 Zn-dependent hydrolase [Alphaproteobacteria bacterium]MBU2149471.1 Zn-dependent hydrolase [Alphaproteobacteria bacterium]MBU2305486.1 Zn-dependent hydrolase [Alphaproteobacteria bacterium]
MTTTRRRAVLQLATGLAATLPVTSWARAGLSVPAVNAERLRRSLEDLSAFGRPAGGTFADGVSRVAYSEADVAGRALAMQLMRAAGLTPVVDAAGNISGRRPGSDPSLRPILIGSHIDTVPGGGNFDGILGSLAAIEVVRTLEEHQVRTRHPIEIAIWSNEEGDPMGSAAATGPVPALLMDSAAPANAAARDALRRIGGDPAKVASARRAPGSIRCYLELHIEQGGVLDAEKVPIGVVEGIVAIDQYEVTIEGVANHAGTTPMPLRQDALIAAAKMIEAVNQIATAEPGAQVATVGKLEVTPNAANVIPGRVRHTVEIRDLSSDKVARLGAAMARRAQQIAAETQTRITMTRYLHLEPALADPALQTAIEAAAANLGLRTMRLPSGAGHDAQEVAKIGPMGMIFVPSVGGVSHSPKEFTTWADCANGANVLLGTLLAVDRKRSAGAR